MFDLRYGSLAGQNLRPIGGTWSCVKRMRILCSGQFVEDIDSYNSAHEMCVGFFVQQEPETMLMLKVVQLLRR